MLEAVTQTAQWTTDLIKSIKVLIEGTAILMRLAAPQIYSRELTELIFVQPYCRIANVVEAGIAQRQTASTYLKQLCTIGLLHEIKAGREKIFVNPAFLKLLTQR
ncbi:hypothetical protein KMZ15_08370 [Mycoavidus sp. HKI]|uniref:hypothetical protein n=1 Tax=Mycoavidus sp. HKI TaxID=2840467 RepID=UPI001CBF527E|nr:hypothetical protein [Mycoavidus sp. HKI]UAW64045.1 hypothetical protein KMZ15_08370 [Mycoavidus sp. HKI]